MGAQHGLAISSRSGLLWGATGLLGLMAVVQCLASIWLSDSSIQQRVDALSQVLTRIQGIEPDGHRRVAFGLVTLGCGMFLLNGIWALNHQDPPDDDDQMAYPDHRAGRFTNAAGCRVCGTTCGAGVLRNRTGTRFHWHCSHCIQRWSSPDSSRARALRA